MIRKKFLTIFNNFEPVMMHKDVGGVPYFLSVVCGWKTHLAFFEMESNLQETASNTDFSGNVSLISLGPRKGRLRNAARIMAFIARNGRQYDVLNFYYHGIVTMLYALLFKLVNMRGIVYFKLDINHLDVEYILNSPATLLSRMARTGKCLLSRRVVDIYTVETTYAFERLRNDEYFKGRLHHLPNGFTPGPDGGNGCWLERKERIILTVGRLGDSAKYNELLVDAISSIDPGLLDGWKVWFVGPVVGKSFRSHVDEAIRKHPQLRDVFVFPGSITNRDELYDIYRRSKIFCLTSRREGFPFVLLEAMYYGNYVISSDLPPARDLTGNGTAGALFPIGDAKQLAVLLSDALSGKVDFARLALESHRIVASRYDWRGIIRDLDRILMSAIDAGVRG